MSFENEPSNLDDQTKSRIEDLLNEGSVVAVAYKRQTIPQGESGIFGLGITNINLESDNFVVDIKFGKAVDRTGSEFDVTYDPVDWLLYENTASLNYNERTSIPVRVSVPRQALPGTYIYNIDVCNFLIVF